MGLGCFPFDNETYLTLSDSYLLLSGIQSLIRVGNLSAPNLFSALPPVNICEASPKAISGRTSYLRVRLEFLRYPQVIRQLFNGGRFGPPVGFTPPSTCSWIGHPVSGLLHATLRAVHPRFPCGSTTEWLNLAAYINSPDRSTKSTTSHLNVLCVLVNIRFQVLFHSPPGVLFTFPSQYWFTIGLLGVFSLTGWSRLVQTGFLVSRLTQDTAILRRTYQYETFTLYGLPFQVILVRCRSNVAVLQPRICRNIYGLGYFHFARRYFGNRCFFLLLLLLRCFSSEGLLTLRCVRSST